MENQCEALVKDGKIPALPDRKLHSGENEGNKSGVWRLIHRRVTKAATLRALSATLICTLLSATVPAAAQPLALASYNAPIGESSISGLSSGAFMAVQFGT